MKQGGQVAAALGRLPACLPGLDGAKAMHADDHQGHRAVIAKKPPVGPSGPMVARRTAISAPWVAAR